MYIKKVAIIGATGLVGKQLTEKLSEQGYTPIILSRNVKHAEQVFDSRFLISYFHPSNISELISLMESCDIVINLAGENIGKKRWTKVQKQRILYSRLSAGLLISSVIQMCKNQPEIFVL